MDNTREMKKALLEEMPRAHVIMMAAAVSDIVPAKRSGRKISKKDGALTGIEFKLNQNILQVLSTIKKEEQFLLGFAAESGYNIGDVLEKFSGRDTDMIVINDISKKDTAIGSDFNEVEIITRHGKQVKLARDTKRMIARGI